MVMDSQRGCDRLLLPWSQQKGAAIVETLIVVPSLFLLVFTVLEFTNILRVYHAVSFTAEEGVREASGGMGENEVRLTPAELRDAEVDGSVLQRLRELAGNSITEETVCVQYSTDGETWDPPKPCICSDPPEPDCPCPDPPEPDCTKDEPSGSSAYGPGNLVRVTIEAQYNPIMPNLLVPEISFTSMFERSISTN